MVQGFPVWSNTDIYGELVSEAVIYTPPFPVTPYFTIDAPFFQAGLLSAVYEPALSRVTV